MNTYTVTDTFLVRDKKIVVLDRKLAVKDAGCSYISVEGQLFVFGLTHNEYWIIVDPAAPLENKTITFTN